MRGVKLFIKIIYHILYIVFTLALLAIQFLLFYLIFFAGEQYPYISIPVYILGGISVLYLYQSNKNRNYTFLWTVLILLLPFAGSILFLIVNNSSILSRKKINKCADYFMHNVNKIPKMDIEPIKEVDKIGYKHLKILTSLSQMPVFKNTECKFYPDTLLKYQDFINSLNNAKEYIFLEFFIISKGKYWDEVKDILIKKSQEGVKIKIIYDDIGSKMTFKKDDYIYLNSFENIRIVAYNPLGVRIRLTANYRDHRKIIIIDGVEAYVGGDNIADEYVHYINRHGFWRDNSVKLIGDAVQGVLLCFIENWYMSTKEKINISDVIREHNVINDSSIHVPFSDGPNNNVESAYSLMESIINNAQDYLYVSTPYFIIDTEFIRTICNIADSGVKVKILIPGIPDKKLIYNMTISHLRPILKSGAEVYLYTPGFNHAKNIICDDKYAICGSINIDYRSLFLHYENADFIMYGKEVMEMKKDFDEAVSLSKRYTYEDWRKRSLLIRITYFIFGIFAPLC